MIHSFFGTPIKFGVLLEVHNHRPYVTIIQEVGRVPLVSAEIDLGTFEIWVKAVRDAQTIAAVPELSAEEMELQPRLRNDWDVEADYGAIDDGYRRSTPPPEQEG